MINHSARLRVSTRFSGHPNTTTFNSNLSEINSDCKQSKQIRRLIVHAQNQIYRAKPAKVNSKSSEMDRKRCGQLRWQRQKRFRTFFFRFLLLLFSAWVKIQRNDEQKLLCDWSKRRMKQMYESCAVSVRRVPYTHQYNHLQNKQYHMVRSPTMRLCFYVWKQHDFQPIQRRPNDSVSVVVASKHTDDKWASERLACERALLRSTWERKKPARTHINSMRHAHRTRLTEFKLLALRRSIH